MEKLQAQALHLAQQVSPGLLMAGRADHAAFGQGQCRGVGFKGFSEEFGMFVHAKWLVMGCWTGFADVEAGG